MTPLPGFQRQYLRSEAHHLKPVVQIGQHGLSETCLLEIDNALAHHELIKIKFGEAKERDDKDALVQIIVERTACHLAGIVGHTAILYRPHTEAEKRRIFLPTRAE